MVSRLRLFPNDEELGKRDDDHKPGKKTLWMKRKWPAVKKRRIVLLAGLCVLTWLFIKNIPTDLGPAKDRFHYGFATPRPSDEQMLALSRGENVNSPPQGAPQKQASTPTVEDSSDEYIHDYDGPVRFYYLAASLHGISRTQGHRSTNKNVLFAASDLKSASIIIPIACEMGKWKKNHVHMAFMGRDEIPMDDLKQINGVDDASCDIFWHDARPDFSAYSTHGRMETSVFGALGHIESFMHPQAIITAGMSSENLYFMTAVRSKAKILKSPVIEVPKEKPESLYWLARLDATALNAWHTASLDIVVQAPLKSSGSLIRLLQSLSSADYSGFSPPRLTIELPHQVDTGTQVFLADFSWPPDQPHITRRQGNELILRRRIPEDKIRADEASTRFIESFYPTGFDGPHVLVLSPQAELSPVYFHYLKYYLLEYRYSADMVKETEDLFGISLESPSVYLNGSAGFEAPLPKSAAPAGDDVAYEPFLWQAPNSNAALYFSDKWMEIHSFLSKRHTAARHPKTRDFHATREKIVSEVFPSWTEFFLDVMRVRGYTLLYPGRFSSGSSASETDMMQSLAIIHNELYQPPEEYSYPTRRSNHVEEAPLPTAAVLTANNDYLKSHQDSVNHPTNIERPLFSNLYAIIPPASQSAMRSTTDDDEASTMLMPDSEPERTIPIAPLWSLTLLDHHGFEITRPDLQERSGYEAGGWRETGGGCKSELIPRKQEIIAGSAQDLFCIDVVDIEPVADERDDATLEREVPRAAPARSPPNLAPPRPHIPTRTSAPGSGGVAAVVDAVVNAEHYRETARAGFQAKLAESSDTDDGTRNANPHTAEEYTHTNTHEASSVNVNGDGHSNNKPGHGYLPPTRAGHIPGSGGVAAGVNAVVDAEGYAATARAGFLAKLTDPTINEAAPVIEADKLALTPAERAELDDWLVKNKQMAPTNGEATEVPAPRAGPAIEAATEDDDAADVGVRTSPRRDVMDDESGGSAEPLRMAADEVPRIGRQRQGEARRGPGPLKMKRPVVTDGDEADAPMLEEGEERPMRGQVDELAAAFRGSKVVSTGDVLEKDQHRRKRPVDGEGSHNGAAERARAEEDEV